MNGIPHPVNLVSKVIIIILTNFRGKSGALNQGSKERTLKFAAAVTGDAGGNPKSCGHGREIFLTIGYISSSY